MLQIRSLQGSEEKPAELFAGMGRFYFNVSKMFSRKMKITTPSAVVAIRGTRLMIVNDGGGGSVLVREGLVLFSAPDGSGLLEIPAGQKSRITVGGQPGVVVPLSVDELKLIDEMEDRFAGETEKPAEKAIDTGTHPVVPPGANTDQGTPADEPAAEKSGKEGSFFKANASIGAVTINGELYNQIGIRPEFSIGKLGIALDLSLYMDQAGNIRKENWDSGQDIFEKIYYVRWGHRGDPFYVKVGAIDNYRLGFGLLMNHYANTIQYPSVIRTGMELSFQGERLGSEFMVNNFGELTDGGGLVAGRLTYKLLGNLTLGASVVHDINQYKALPDRDGDGVPDEVDDLPDNKDFAVDSDGDGMPDATDPDRDGDGYTDNDPAKNNDDDFDPANLKPEPFNVDEAANKSQTAFAVDISYPLINMKHLQLTAYSQFAQFANEGGWGITAPGVLAKFAFINAFAEYRIFDVHFLPEYFNTTYELERAVFRADSETGGVRPFTKAELLDDINEALKGFVVGADFNIFDFVVFGAEYQNMSKSDLKIRTLRSSLDLNTSFIPKINQAGAYYIQNNADKLFIKTEGTVLGYKLGYEIGGGASLLLDFRQTYRDLNGDGDIKGSNEVVRTTIIQTVMQF